MLDLSHWHKKNNNIPFDLTGYKGVDQQLVALHKKLGAVCYVEMGSFFDLYLEDDTISDKTWTDANGVFHREITTPLGQLSEERVFEQTSYSYNIRKRLLNDVSDFEICRYVMERYQCKPRFDRLRAWEEALGEVGYMYFQIPYSGLGYLISRNFGVEKTCLAMFDNPGEVKALIDTINTCNLRILDKVIDGPFDALFISDNFDSNIQNPGMFDKFVRDYYTTVAGHLHERGKYLAIHVDGEMKGCLKNMADCGVDCIDAATPAPMFNLTPKQARDESGADLILSGGIPATVFGATGTEQEFVKSVREWLDIKNDSPRLILAAGDQVPPDAPWERIAMLPELVATYGKY